MKTQKTALFLALALASGVAFAERGGEEPIPPAASSSGSYSQNGFEQLDVNGDGQLSQDEAQAGALPEMFLFMDRNQDGALSRSEFNHRER